MKKKWLLFLLFPLLLILVFVLTIYIWKSPKKIKSESMGTKYSFMDIQFDMISDDFYPLTETYNELVDLGEESLMPYKNSKGETMFVSKRENPNSFYEDIQELKNPINILLIEREMLNTVDPASGYQAKEYKINLFEGENKKAILHYSVNQEDKISWSVDILLDDQLYSISLIGNDLEADAYEVIRTVNIKN